MADTQELRRIADRLRFNSVRVTDEAGSGHVTSSLSAADLVAVLFANHLLYDFGNTESVYNDRFILSKGHASPLLYAAFNASGVIDEATLLTYRKKGSKLEGHPTPVLPWVNFATGSLGQGLPIGVGSAISAKHMYRVPAHTWVLCGDSELAEGSVWEAADAATDHKLGNLTLIVDVNRLGQRGETRHGWNLSAYADRFRAFGWDVIEIDGHDLAEIDNALAEAKMLHGHRPMAVLARTIKGKGAPAVENQNGSHGEPLKDSSEVIRMLKDSADARLMVSTPPTNGPPHTFTLPNRNSFQRPWYEAGESVATRDAYGDTITYLASIDRSILALDAEVSNSTRAKTFKKKHPERFLEMYIAEQQMIGTAVGLQADGWKPFCSTFACFLTRAYDFVRMAAVSRADLRICGSHAGVAIGEDGPSQMGLEDIAMMRAIYGSTVLSPSDANQSVTLIEMMSEQRGISYIRTMRPKTTVLYPPGTHFEIGGSKTWGASSVDDITIIGTGITVHEALRAQKQLESLGVSSRVIDAYSIKPIDENTIRRAVSETRGIVIVEDHHPEGGLGEAVMSVMSASPERLRLNHLAVRNMPGSATGEQQLEEAGINADAIVEASTRLLARPPGMATAR